MFHLTPVAYYDYSGLHPTFIKIIIIIVVIIIIIIIFRLSSIMLSRSCRIWHIIIVLILAAAQRPTFILGKSFASTKFIIIIMGPNVPLRLSNYKDVLFQQYTLSQKIRMVISRKKWTARGDSISISQNVLMSFSIKRHRHYIRAPVRANKKRYKNMRTFLFSAIIPETKNLWEIHWCQNKRRFF